MVMEVRMEFDESIELADNAMLKKRPELFYEWDFEKNIGLNVYEIKQGSGRFAWWVCKKCKSSYDTVIYARTGKKKNSCSYCSGHKVNHTNSLAAIRPDLTTEWHPTKNEEITPHDVTYSRNQKVWWLGKCGHEWEATINSRNAQGTGCPYCSGRKALIGFNDMWTTNPDLARLLADPEDGYKYTQSSGMRANWKCLSCKEIIKDKVIASINEYGLPCPRCSDGVKFPEKFMYNLLKEANIDFVFDKAQKWSQRKRYDFYLPEYRCIIETNGEQHYYERRQYKDKYGKSKTLNEEQENDKLKEQLARENGIDNYIVIDCRESSVEWISNSILNSNIIKIVKNIDFEKIGQLASKNLVKETCDLWNSGVRGLNEIGKIMKIERNTVSRYLRRGNEIGWCAYCPDESRKIVSRILKSRTKPLVQLDMDYHFVNSWDSAREAEKGTGVSFKSISQACKGVIRSSGSFRWMFKEDYEQYLAGNLELPPPINKRGMRVVQLDKQSNSIKSFDSQMEAADAVGLAGSATISHVCKGKLKTAAGYRWMHKEDYDKMIQEGLSHGEYMSKYYPKNK